MRLGAPGAGWALTMLSDGKELDFSSWSGAGLESAAWQPHSRPRRAPVLLLGIKPFSHLEAAPAQPGLSKQMTSGVAGSSARAQAPSPRSLMSPAGTGRADAASPARSCFPRLFGLELIFPSPPQQGSSPGARPVRCCLPWLPKCPGAQGIVSSV